MKDKMRNIFDNMLFIFQDEHGEKGCGLTLDPEFEPYIKDIVFDPDAIVERYILRELFMKKQEALIHTDYHTSNIFIGEDEMKVIDMEYSFCGPIAFDLGYLFGNLISQYVCACYRPCLSEENREEFKKYILDTLNDTYEKYCKLFLQFWNSDAKDEYKNVAGLQEEFLNNLLEHTIGFCSTANLFRIASEIDFPEYSAIEDPMDRRHAVVLSALMDRRMLLKRKEFKNISDWTEDIENMAKVYDCYLKKCLKHGD